MPSAGQGQCLASLHVKKECGQEQDWNVVSPGEHIKPSGNPFRSTQWRTPQEAEKAATLYHPGASNIPNKVGTGGDNDPAKAAVPLPDTPRSNNFLEVASGSRQGQDQDQPAVYWYNGEDGGPCGDAEITVDYYCFEECVRECQHGGVLNKDDCTCTCPKEQFWTGVECQLCGAQEADCAAGFKVDKADCMCKDPNAIVEQRFSSSASASVSGLKKVNEAAAAVHEAKAELAAEKTLIDAKLAQTEAHKLDEVKAAADAAAAAASDKANVADAAAKATLDSAKESATAAAILTKQ
jgi:hypothetical protein